MNILILTTSSGRNFGRAVSHRLRSQLRELTGEHHVYRYRVTAIDEAFRNHPEFSPTNTIIHCRAAHPTAQWMQRLVALEASGYCVVNTTYSLKLTSDKLKFWEAMNDLGLAAYDDDEYEVFTWQLPRQLTQEWLTATASQLNQSSPQGVVIKPRYSQGQGTFVNHVPWVNFVDLRYMRDLLSTMPACPIIMQKVIDYTAIYRVVVIGGLIYVQAITYDEPTTDNWKVSVCLNRHQRWLELDDTNANLALHLGQYAALLQAAVSGDINFVDIFETHTGELVVSEINTACNLSYHSQITGTDFADVIARHLRFMVVTMLSGQAVQAAVDRDSHLIRERVA